MTLAEQNHAEELKRVCLEFVSKNLSAVMITEGYQHMMSSCPTLQVGGLVNDPGKTPYPVSTPMISMTSLLWADKAGIYM